MYSKAVQQQESCAIAKMTARCDLYVSALKVFTRNNIYAIACICHGNSVRLSVRPSHGWISQKRLKLGSRNFHLQ